MTKNVRKARTRLYPLGNINLATKTKLQRVSFCEVLGVIGQFLCFLNPLIFFHKHSLKTVKTTSQHTHGSELPPESLNAMDTHGPAAPGGGERESGGGDRNRLMTDPPNPREYPRRAPRTRGVSYSRRRAVRGVPSWMKGWSDGLPRAALPARGGEDGSMGARRLIPRGAG